MPPQAVIHTFGEEDIYLMHIDSMPRVITKLIKNNFNDLSLVIINMTKKYQIISEEKMR